MRAIDWRRIETRMSIAPEYIGKKFCNFDVGFNKQKVKAAEIEHAARNRRWIILSGDDPGVGKTHLAIAAMKLSWRMDRAPEPPFYETEAVPDEDSYRFIPMRDWGQRIVSAGYRAEEIWDETVNGCRCLLLDDLGFEPERCNCHISRLVDDYYRRQRQLIITTNLDADGLVYRYGGAIVDRIIGKAGRIIEMTGRSYRQQGDGR